MSDMNDILRVAGVLNESEHTPGAKFAAALRAHATEHGGIDYSMYMKIAATVTSGADRDALITLIDGAPDGIQDTVDYIMKSSDPEFADRLNYMPMDHELIGEEDVLTDPDELLVDERVFDADPKMLNAEYNPSINYKIGSDIMDEEYGDFGGDLTSEYEMDESDDPAWGTDDPMNDYEPHWSDDDYWSDQDEREIDPHEYSDSERAEMDEDYDPTHDPFLDNDDQGPATNICPHCEGTGGDYLGNNDCEHCGGTGEVFEAEFDLADDTLAWENCDRGGAGNMHDGLDRRITDEGYNKWVGSDDDAMSEGAFTDFFSAKNGIEEGVQMYNTEDLAPAAAKTKMTAHDADVLYQALLQKYQAFSK